MNGRLITGLVVLLMALGVCLAVLPSVACNSGSTTDPGGESHSQESVQTFGATITCDPQYDSLPASVKICVSIQNLVDSPRTVDGRIDLWFGEGEMPLYEWRFREVDLAPSATWEHCWNNQLLDLHNLEDKNIARLRVVDVTPPPYNQPPYPPSGYTVEDVCIFWGSRP